MTIQMVRQSSFGTPTITPLRGTLLNAARVTDGVDFLDPAGLYESFNCLAMDSKAAFPCPATTLGAPAQSAAATAGTGGTLAAGTYRAVITAVNDRGETIKSNEQSQATTGATSTVTFTWAAVSGATSYKVYITNGAAGSQAQSVSTTGLSYTLTAYPPSGVTTGSPPASSTAVVTVTKTFSGPTWNDGIRFAVYGGLTCKGVARDPATDAQVQAAFTARESIGVARALMQMRFIAGSTWSAAPDLTPAGGAVDPAVGLAILENDAACKYAGAPTIHAPRGIGTLLTRYDMAELQGDTLYSKQGSKIASDGGYGCPNNSPTNAAPAAGEQWVYASGEVSVARSETIVRSELDRTTNEFVVLVERLYVAAVDCYTAAVKVKVA